MRIRASMGKQEIVAFLAGIFPLEILLQADGDGEEQGRVRVEDPGAWELVPGEGLLVRAKATLFWPLPLLRDGIGLAAVQLRIVPQIEERGAEWALVFQIRLEELPLPVLSAGLSAQVSERINLALQRAGVEVAWIYTETLRVQIDLPEQVRPTQQFQMGALPAELEIREDEIVIVGELTLRFARLSSAT